LALAFVGLFWILITLAAVGRAHVVGWPGFLKDDGALALSAVSLTILIIVLVFRNEIIKPSSTLCPKCGVATRRGQFAAWQFVLVVCFFPLGLLALLAGRQPTECPNCGHVWQV